MSFDDAIEALSTDALKFVSDGQILGLGSGRAATAFVKSLSRLVRAGGCRHQGRSHITTDQNGRPAGRHSVG